MFEVITYLIPMSIAFILILVSIPLAAASLFTLLLAFRPSTKSWFLFTGSLIAFAFAMYVGFTPNVAISNNPTIHDLNSSRVELKVNKEELTKTIADEINVEEISLTDDDNWNLTYKLSNGEAVEFTSASDEGTLKGAVNFTNENMIITLFESNEDNIIVPVK